MPQILGLNKLKKTFDRLEKEASKSNVSVQVGYTQRYALVVHEDLTANHNVGKAKYLEGPARRMQNQLARIVRTVYKKTGNMEQALLVAGLRLQRTSQQEVPVDTSALKASAYTALEKDADSESQKAFNKSERIRKAAGK